MSDEIAARIEASLWDYEPEWMPPDIEVVERPDLMMWTTPGGGRVVKAVFPEEDVERRIDEVLAFFRERGRSPDWELGPSSRPPDLADRLRARGFREAERYEGLARSLDELAEPAESDVRVELVETEAQVREMVDIAAAVWSYSPEREEAVVRERLSYLELPTRRGGYLLARIGGLAVGYGAWRDSADGQAVYLTGGATLPEYRGQGVYLALLSERLRAAKERGVGLATVLARVGTSAPILRKRGFEQYFELPVMSDEARVASYQ